jgi:hypothetical protein
LHLSSFDTLILQRVLILGSSLAGPENDDERVEYQKGRFLIRAYAEIQEGRPTLFVV